MLGFVTDEPVSTLLTPGIQLAFANFYLGIAEGALERGKQILLGRKNAWLFSQADTYAQDPIFQRIVGELKARTAAVAALNAEIRNLVDRPETAARFAQMGGVPAASTPEQFQEFVAAEIRKWDEVIKREGLQLDVS